jgi:hypothetical protein
MKSRTFLLIICCIMFSLPSHLFSQNYLNYRVGFNGSIPLGDLKEMNDTLQIADAAQKSDLLAKLGINKEVADAHASADISIQAVQVLPRKTFGIVFLPCDVQPEAWLILLDDSGSKSWHAIDEVALDCFLAKTTYRLLSLTPGEDLIIAQHANSGHGSDRVVEDSTTLYSVRAGKFSALLSTRDFRSQPDFENPSLVTEQTSTFLFFPNQIIEETRITARNGVPRKVERRLWKRSPGRQTFRAEPFRTVTP